MLSTYLRCMLISKRTLLVSVMYILLSLLIVNLGNEGGENTPLENLSSRGIETAVLYYGAQIALLAGYLYIIRLDWITTLIVLAVVILIRNYSSGVAILTIATVLGREFVVNQAAKKS